MLCPIVKLLPEEQWKARVQHFNINGMSFQARDYYEALDLYELALQAEQATY